MNEHMDSEQKLERLMTQTLRGLPMRRAPGSLEARVLEELQHRAALPWWRVGFAQWSTVPRAAFVVVCAALVAATILGGTSAVVGLGSLNQAAALPLSWMQPLLTLLSSAGGVAALIVRVIPPLWLYGALAFGIVLYVALFGLGAAAYRMLYRPSSAGGL
ncbi:MAG: hypothetical protein QOF70_6422 [Acetobacteraceae bacterium]|jgi:hypothetical protein|nr:hypothetical protein [Gammaproteobacteria bacterium]MEA2731947.1 hypothetical protein [Acetobacteraceae bacterium]MEA3141113.1 hypothetical protein [Gammaproteobacteria bacterium]